MKLRNVLIVAGKEASVAPRGLTFILVLVFPVLITFLVHAVLGDLFAPSPRLGIHDAGASELAELARRQPGLRLTEYGSQDALRAAVTAHDVDAGLALQADFDAMILRGERPALQLFLSSETPEADRVVLSVTIIDLVREVAGQPAPLGVETVMVGDGDLVPIEDRLIPLLVLVAVALAAIFLPGSTIVQERETRTIQALLVTPLRVEEIMAGKGIVGFVLAMVMGMVTVLIGGVSGQTGAILVVLAVAALMCAQFGLMLGAAVSNMATLFSVWKAGGIVLFAPGVLLLFPGVPVWISRVFPTFYFLGPLYEISVHGASLESQLLDLGIGVLISFVLMAAVGALSRRMERRLAVG